LRLEVRGKIFEPSILKPSGEGRSSNFSLLFS
jgi:hypothetical protein